MQHDQPDPNVCPTCERSGALRELAKDLANADRLDTVNGAEKIADADARAEAFALSLAILAGNGEA